MAHAKAIIGTTNYAVAITTGHHQLNADEGSALGGKDTGPSPFEIRCAACRSMYIFQGPARLSLIHI